MQQQEAFMQDGFLPSEPCPFDKRRERERQRERDRSIAEMKGSLLPAGFELNTSMNSQKQDLQ